MKNHSKVRSIFAALLSFLMALSLVVGLLMSFVAFATYTPFFASAVLKQSRYAEEAQKELREEFVSYGHASNINEDFFVSFFETDLTVEAVEKDCQILLKNFFAGAEKLIDTTEMEASLFEKLKTYATEQGFHLDPQLEENLKTIAKELGEFYRDYLSVLSENYFKSASNILLQFRSILLYAVVAALLIFAIATLILTAFYRKKSNRLRFCIYAFSGAALMLLVAPILALLFKVADKINIGSMALYSLATGMMKGVLVSVLLLALIPILVTAFLSFAYQKALQEENSKAQES